MADQALLPDPTHLPLLHLEAESNMITATVKTTVLSELKPSSWQSTHTSAMLIP